jgi:hypothetical protein
MGYLRRIFTLSSVVVFLLVLISGCSKLTDSQQTAVTFIDGLFVKKTGEDYQIHKRAEVLLPIIPTNPTNEDMSNLKFLLEMVQSLHKKLESENRSPEEINKEMEKENFLQNYINGPYYITQNPLKPETETSSSQIVYVPSSSYEKEEIDEYVDIQLIKEDGKWKVSDFISERDEKISKYWKDHPDAWQKIDP